MLDLIIIGAITKKNISVFWLEVQTPTGNLVIQEGHASMIIVLSRNQKITFALNDITTESMLLRGGLLEIRRTSATIIIDE